MLQSWLAFSLIAVPATASATQCPDGSAPPCGARAGAPATSVAVLYFEDLGADSMAAALAAGLTEELILRLGQKARLTVKSRAAVHAWRGSSEGPATLGRTLGVAHLVTGTVQRSGDRVRITIELVRAAMGVHVWGEQYDHRGGVDWLDVQGDVARAAASAVEQRLTRNGKAHQRFLRANARLAQGTLRGAQDALADFRDAVRQDPGLAAAHAGIALAYDAFLEWGGKPDKVVRDSLVAAGFAAVDSALRQDSAAADAWTALGVFLARHHPRSYTGVREAFARALALDPRNAETLERYATALVHLGADSTAVEYYRRALAVEPGRASAMARLSLLHFAARRLAEARMWCDSAVAVQPAFAPAYAVRAQIHAARGDTTAARADAESALRFGGGYRLAGEAALAMVQGIEQDTAGARRTADRLLRRIDEAQRLTEGEAWLAAAALTAAGDAERAMAVLQRATPGLALGWVLRLPAFDALRERPEFRRLVEGLRSVVS